MVRFGSFHLEACPGIFFKHLVYEISFLSMQINVYFKIHIQDTSVIMQTLYLWYSSSEICVWSDGLVLLSFLNLDFWGASLL